MYFVLPSKFGFESNYQFKQFIYYDDISWNEYFYLNILYFGTPLTQIYFISMSDNSIPTFFILHLLSRNFCDFGNVEKNEWVSICFIELLGIGFGWDGEGRRSLKGSNPSTPSPKTPIPKTPIPKTSSYVIP